MDIQTLFRPQQEESLGSLYYILPASRAPSSIEVLEVLYHEPGRTECRTEDIAEKVLMRWLEQKKSMLGSSKDSQNQIERSSIFILGPSHGHFGYESEKFPGFDSYPSDGLPVSLQLYEKIESELQLPAATKWSLVASSTHFQKYEVDMGIGGEKGLGFTMRLASRGIIEIDVCLSISYRPGNRTVRAFLHGCTSQQQLMIRTRLQRWSTLTEHPLLLPLILVEIKADRIEKEQIDLWNLLVRVEGQSKQTGAPAIKKHIIDFAGQNSRHEAEAENAQKSRVDSDFKQVTIGVVGVIQRTTGLGSHTRALLLSISEMRKSIQAVSNLASAPEAVHLKKIGEMLSGKLDLLEHRTRVMDSDIEFIEKRAQAQQAAVYNFLAQRDAKLQRDLAEFSKEISQAAKRDSSAMKGIAILTMVFLPGTYIATFFTMPILDFSGHSRLPSVSHSFWLYWTITVPLTLIVLLTYLSYVFHVNQKYKSKSQNE